MGYHVDISTIYPLVYVSNFVCDSDDHFHAIQHEYTQTTPTGCAGIAIR